MAGLIAVGAVVVVMVGLVRHADRETLRLCGRSFRRGLTMWTDDEVRALGSMHRVGTARAGDEIWTVARAWPGDRCDGLTPTVLLSRNGADWTTWVLVGGP